MADMNSKKYREEMGPLAKQIRDMVDLVTSEQRDFTPEEQETWTKINGEFDRLKRSAELAERVEDIVYQTETSIDEQRQQRKPGGDDVNHRGNDERQEERQAPEITEETRSLALAGWVRAKCNIDLEPKHSRACELVGIRPHAQGDLELKFRTDDYQNIRRESRALSGLTDTAGAYTIPTGFINNLEISMLAFGGMRQMSEVIRTESGNNLPWPTSDDTSNSGALIGENTAVSEQDVTFGQVVFQAYKYTSKMVKVPYELLRDSAFDVASVLGRMLGERIGRITNEHFTTGDGNAKPKGIVTCASTGKSAASASAIAADELFDLLHSIDPAYRNGSGVGFMMHDSILLVIRKLKDGNGQYLWQPGLTAREPDRILGFPVVNNQSMASSITSGAKSVLFGDLSKYKIRDVAGFRLRRLTERYAESDQEAFVAFSCHDGNLLDAGTDPVKALVH